MEYRKFENDYVLRLEKGEEIISSLTKFCELEKIELASVSGIGASDNVIMGLYNVQEKKYYQKEFKEALEITSLVGNISQMNNEIYLHLHINLCDEKMNCIGGHLNKCFISATCEIFIHKINGHVDRRYDEITGLNLFEFND